MKAVWGVLCALSLLASACQPILPASPLPSPTLTQLPVTPLAATQTAIPTSIPSTPTVKAVIPTASPAVLPEETPPAGEFTLCSPLQHETIASLFEIIGDPYKPPPPGREERHHGVDFSYYHHGDRDTIEGEGVRAILPGRVVAMISDRLPYGNMVILETSLDLLPADLVSLLNPEKGDSLYHLYAHMQEAPLVELGDTLECGQALGLVGMSGYNVINAHLHLETRLGPAGVTFPGMAFYTTTATQAEMDNYVRWRTGGEFRHFDPLSLFTWYLDH